MIRWVLIVTVLASLTPSLAQAQDDDAGNNTPTDYGAGFQVVTVNKHQEHAPDMPNDPQDASAFGPIKLNLTYPMIAAPLTPDTNVYNATITQLIPLWWRDIGGPKDNAPASDPDTDVSLACVPVGLPPPDDVPTPAGAKMLPGVISMACGSYEFTHGDAHGGGEYWGFNWLVSQHRPIKPDDIFIPNSGWLKALTALANADRADATSLSPKLDFADRHHWVIRTDGLGLTYSFNDFAGYEDGGCGDLDIIPWSKLAPYLRKDGIVPEKYWDMPQ